MATLFNDTSELKKYVNVVGTFNIDLVSIHIDSALQRFVKGHTGPVLLLNALNHFGNPNIPDPEPEEEQEEGAETETSEALDKLLPYIQDAAAKFSFYLAIPHLDVQITSAGFAVVSNNNLAPASDKRVNALSVAMELDGWNAIETMLQFLEENKDDYPSWVNSDAYTINYSTIINSAEQFDKIIRINKSRLEFQKLLPDIEDVEKLRIEPVISKDLADSIRTEIKENDVSEANNKILNLLRKAIAYFAWCDSGRCDIIMMNKYKLLAEQYLSQVRIIMDENKTDYPEYAESSVVTTTSYEKFENKEDNSIFNFGG